jgi:hypothetical protein
VLRPRETASVPRKMQRTYSGPFAVIALLGPKTLSVALPPEYSVFNNAFNFEDVRPWLDHEAHAFEPDYPVVEPHPSANRISKFSTFVLCVVFRLQVWTTRTFHVSIKYCGLLELLSGSPILLLSCMIIQRRGSTSSISKYVSHAIPRVHATL